MKARSRLVTLASIFFFVSGCLEPPLETKIRGGVVDVNISTLGEYPTSVSRIRLSEAGSNRVVWELKSEKKVPQLWGFKLQEGGNSVLPEGVLNGGYRVLVPARDTVFTLYRDKAYLLEVWNKSGFRHASAPILVP